jgi:hypothetical protein
MVEEETRRRRDDFLLTLVCVCAFAAYVLHDDERLPQALRCQILLCNWWLRLLFIFGSP